MAAGDLAASQAGFVPALSSDDLRLGYSKIDEAADLAFRYGPLSFASTTALLAYTGAAPYQRAVDRATGDEYRWSGTAWQLWNTGWRGYTPALTGPNGAKDAAPGWAQNYSQYRYAEGKVRWRAMVLLNGGTAALTSQWQFTLPVQPSFPAANQKVVPAGTMRAVDASAGKDYLLHGVINWNTNILRVDAQGDAAGGLVATAAGAPFVWAQSDQVLFTIEYDVL